MFEKKDNHELKPKFILSKRNKINILLVFIFLIGLASYFIFLHPQLSKRQYLNQVQKIYYRSDVGVRTSRDLVRQVGANLNDTQVINDDISQIENDLEKVRDINQQLAKLDPPDKYKYLHNLLTDYYASLELVLSGFLDIAKFSLEINSISKLLTEHPIVNAIKKDFVFDQAVNFQKETDIILKEAESLKPSFQFSGQIRDSMVEITDHQITMVDDFINFQRLQYEVWLGNIYSKVGLTKEAYDQIKESFTNLEKTPEIYDNIQKLNELNTNIAKNLELAI